MEFKVWSSISYSELDPLIPFICLYQSDDLNDILKYVNENGVNTLLFITNNNGNIIGDSMKQIYKCDNDNILKNN
jgi:hypothetical protein